MSKSPWQFLWVAFSSVFLSNCICCVFLIFSGPSDWVLGQEAVALGWLWLHVSNLGVGHHHTQPEGRQNTKGFRAVTEKAKGFLPLETSANFYARAAVKMVFLLFIAPYLLQEDLIAPMQKQLDANIANYSSACRRIAQSCKITKCQWKHGFILTQDTYYWISYLSAALIFLFFVFFCGGPGMCSAAPTCSLKQKEFSSLHMNYSFSPFLSLCRSGHRYSQQWALHTVQPIGSFCPCGISALVHVCNARPHISIYYCRYL